MFSSARKFAIGLMKYEIYKCWTSRMTHGAPPGMSSAFDMPSSPMVQTATPIFQSLNSEIHIPSLSDSSLSRPFSAGFRTRGGSRGDGGGAAPEALPAGTSLPPVPGLHGRKCGIPFARRPVVAVWRISWCGKQEGDAPRDGGRSIRQ